MSGKELKSRHHSDEEVYELLKELRVLQPLVEEHGSEDEKWRVAELLSRYDWNGRRKR